LEVEKGMPKVESMVVMMEMQKAATLEHLTELTLVQPLEWV